MDTDRWDFVETIIKVEWKDQSKQVKYQTKQLSWRRNFELL
jgi:hypothetical protein